MRVSTIILTTIWAALGIPLWFVMNFWTDKWYVPFPIHPDENFVVWLVTLSLVYLLPLYLLSVAAFYLMRRYWR